MGSAKSATAAKRAQTMNPSIAVDARQDLVADTTEHVFTESFWNELDLVCNALDNMKARLYVDGQVGCAPTHLTPLPPLESFHLDPHP